MHGTCSENVAVHRSFALLVVASISWAVACTFSRPVAPEQPIDFSHRDHVRGSDQLDCALCHSGARRSAFAGIAPVERCMGCHRYVLTSNPEITKLRRAWDAGKTIEWVKVYALPQFVRFNHGAHALASVSCDACHGDVGSMNRVVRAADLNMGWCVTCHRDRGASIDCIACHH
ncbi:MAG: hypothetical protein DMG01_04275 [Acidobacteria bacterium]|nr:MAG: hypothetical protein DMG01_04275 [Acidobacteriota bacterium]